MKINFARIFPAAGKVAARLLWLQLCLGAFLAPGQNRDFAQGIQHYHDGNFDLAADRFQKSAAESPGAAVFHDLGNAEWQCGRTGPAILAWERARWLNPYRLNSRTNLAYARQARLLEPPELTWYESCSTWFPTAAWPWIASLSFWLSLALLLLPVVFHWRKTGWHQALAAAGFAIFLLTIPALAGIQTRSKLGVVLPREISLRMTPTTDAQVVAKLPSGEIARLERSRGQYLFIRTASGSGWVDRASFGLIVQSDPKIIAR